MKLLDYIYKVEGNEIHYNSTETDITTMGGIYRAAHPGASIFTFIDKLASQLGLPTDSSTWSHTDVDTLSTHIKAGDYQAAIDSLVMEFYDEYNKNAHLSKFTPLVQTAMFSLYANSPKNAWKSVQSAINKFHTNGLIDYKVQTVDGSPGSTTFNGLDLVKEASDDKATELLFESYILLEMAQIYAKLAKGNPAKFLTYLNGWNNRLEGLAES